MPPADFILRVAALHDWPAIDGIAGTEAAWRGATKRLTPARAQKIDALLETYERELMGGNDG